MGLVINIDGKVIRGDANLCFYIEKGSEVLTFVVYQDDFGRLKVFFDGPKTFRITKKIVDRRGDDNEND